MPVLKNLPDVAQPEVECVHFRKANEVEAIINDGLAATAAGGNGAINVWRDDFGNIRCESMRFCITLDTKVFESINAAALKWIRKWLKEIN